MSLSILDSFQFLIGYPSFGAADAGPTVIPPSNDLTYLRRYLNDPDKGILEMTTLSDSFALDFGTINDGEIGVQTVALIGASPGLVVAIGPPATLEAGLHPIAVVIAINVVEIRLLYASSGAGPTNINPASGIYRVTVFIP